MPAYGLQHEPQRGQRSHCGYDMRVPVLRNLLDNPDSCHGPDGKGNPLMGAPDLTDDIWLYGGSRARIRETLADGRSGVMPAQKDILYPEKIHLLAAYVYSLSQN